MTTDLQVNFEPHFNVLTRSGKAHFSNIKDAICELVDNSIQATNQNLIQDGRSVRIFLDIGKVAGSSFLIVWDNGCGMDAQGIKEFATYFLGQNERGLAPSREDDQVTDKKGASSRISKFGVGAIQSGFYIGSSITVVSRKSCSLDDSVLEFTMDEEKFQNSTSGNVFQGNIKQREPYKTMDVLNASRGNGDDRLSALWNIVVDRKLERDRTDLMPNRHDNSLSSDSNNSGGGFTFVAMRLRHEHEEYFRMKEGTVGYLAKQLSHTYHYYLHPSSSEESEDQLSQFGYQRGNLGVGGIPKSVSKQKVEISVSSKGHALGLSTGELAYANEQKVINLNELKGMEYFYLQNAARSFPFSIVLDHSDDQGKEMKHRVHGEVRYYPHNGSRESMPRFQDLDEQKEGEGDEGAEGDDDDDDDDDNDIDVITRKTVSTGSKRPNIALSQRNGNFLTQASQVNTQLSDIGGHGEGSTLVDDLSTSIGEKTFDVYWSHRLVPESKVDKLPFFPSERWITEHRDAIGPLSLSRLHGSIFFDWHFPISNNKLRLLPTCEGMQGDNALSALLHDEERVTWNEGRLKNLKDKFSKFLVECHKLDKETTFHDRIHVGAEESPNALVFKSMTLGAVGGGGESFKSGDKVLIKQRGNGSKSGSVLGEIIYFVAAPTSTPTALVAPSTSFLSAASSSLSQEQHGIQVQGRGSFKLKRLPVSIWPDEKLEYDVGHLNSSTRFDSNNMNEMKKEVDKLEKQLPRSLEVSLYPDAEKEHYFISKSKRDFLSNATKPKFFKQNDVTRLVAGDQKIALVVKVKNGKDKTVFKQSSRGGGNWIVRVSLISPDGKTIFEHISKTATKSKYPIPGVQEAREMLYYFNGFDIRGSGKHKLVVDVLRKEPSLTTSSKRSNMAMNQLANISDTSDTSSSDNVVVSHAHIFEVMATAPESVELSWKLPVSPPPSTSRVPSSEHIVVRLGEPLPTLDFKLFDEFRNMIDESSLLMASGGSIQEQHQQRKNMSLSQGQLLRHVDWVPTDCAQVEIEADNFTFTFEEDDDEGDIGSIKCSTDQEEGEKDEPRFECGNIGNGNWIMKPTENAMFNSLNQKSGVLVKAKVILTFSIQEKGTGSALSQSSTADVNITETKIDSTVMLLVFPGKPKKIARINLEGEKMDDKVVHTDGEEFPTMSFHLFDLWGNYTFPLVPSSSNDMEPPIVASKSSKKKSAKKSKATSSASTGDESLSSEKWEIVLRLLSETAVETGQGSSSNAKLECEDRHVSRVDADGVVSFFDNGLVSFSDLGIYIPSEEWLPLSSQGRQEMNFFIRASFKLNEKEEGYQSNVMNDNEQTLENSCDVPVKVQPNVAPVEFVFYSGDEPYTPSTHVAGTEFEMPDIRCFDGTGRPILIAEVLQKVREQFQVQAELSKNKKKSKKRSSSETQELFYGVELFWKSRKVHSEEWSNPDFHEEGYKILLPNIPVPSSVTKHNETNFSCKITLPGKEIKTHVIESHFNIEAGEPMAWQVGCASLAGDGEGSDNESDAENSKKLKKKQKKAKASDSKQKGKKFPKSVAVGTKLCDLVQSVYLVDANKNKVTSQEWLDKFSPKVVLAVRGSDSVPTVARYSLCTQEDLISGRGELGDYLLDSQQDIIITGTASKVLELTVETDKETSTTTSNPKDKQHTHKKVKVVADDVAAAAMEDDDTTDEEGLVETIKLIEMFNKTIKLEAGQPHSITLRANSLAQCSEWRSKLEAPGSLLAGYQLQDLQLQLLDIAGNVCPLSDAKIDICIDLCSGGSKKLTLNEQNYRVSRNEPPMFQLPALSLTNEANKEEERTSSKTKKSKASKISHSTSLEDGCLLNVKGVVSNVKSNHLDLDPYDLESAMLCGSIKSVNKVKKLECRLFDTNAAATKGRDLFAYSISGEDFAAHTISSDTDEMPTILVKCINSDGTEYVPTVIAEGGASSSSSSSSSCLFSDPRALKLSCSYLTQGTKKNRKTAVQNLYEPSELATNQNGDPIGIFFKGIKKTRCDHDELNAEDDHDEESSTIKVGKYVLTLQYRETREEMLKAFQGVGDDATQVDDVELRVESSFTMEVVTGTPTGIKFNRQHSEFLVSDGEDRKPRTLPNLILSIVDRTGCACTEAGLQLAGWGPLPTEGSQTDNALISSSEKIGLKCRIARDENEETRNSGERGDVLKFEGSDVNGWVTCEDQEWLEKGNKYHFKDLIVENNPNVQDGSFTLEFKAMFRESVLDAELASKMLNNISTLTATLVLSTDRQRLAEEKEKQERIEILEQELEPLKQAKDELFERQQQLQDEVMVIEDSVRRESENIPQVYQDAIMFDPSQQSNQEATFPKPDYVNGRLSRWREELRERTRVGSGLAGQRRPAVVTKTNCAEFTAQVDALNPIGRVVDLAFIEDDELAELVSWAYLSKMSAVVVETKEDTTACFRLRAKSYALNLQSSFSRNDEHRRNKELPLPRVSWAPNKEVKYLINEIDILDKHEKLRESLFYSIFGRTMIFDTMEDMNDFREYCATKKQNYPLLLVKREGIKVGSDGLIDPNSTLNRTKEGNKSRKKPPLGFVFGSLPEGESNDALLLAKACEHGSQVLTHLKEYFINKEKYDDFMIEHGTELTELEDKVEEKEKELRELKGVKEARIPKKKKARR